MSNPVLVCPTVSGSLTGGTTSAGRPGRSPTGVTRLSTSCAVRVGPPVSEGETRVYGPRHFRRFRPGTCLRWGWERLVVSGLTPGILVCRGRGYDREGGPPAPSVGPVHWPRGSEKGPYSLQGHPGRVLICSIPCLSCLVEDCASFVGRLPSTQGRPGQGFDNSFLETHPQTPVSRDLFRTEDPEVKIR